MINGKDEHHILELCGCIDCHNADLHQDDLVEWAQVCGACDIRLEQAIKDKEYCPICQVWWCQSHI